MKDWYLYVVECSDGSLYTGITTDITRRMHEHNNTKRGAKYTRARRPVNLLSVIGTYRSRSEASHHERAFKSLSRKSKLRVIDESQPKPRFKKSDLVLISTWFVDPINQSKQVKGMIISVIKEKNSHAPMGLHKFMYKFKYAVLLCGKVIVAPEQGMVKIF